MLEAVASASALETGMGTDTVTLGCPISSPGHSFVGRGEHPVTHPGPPGHSLDPCGTFRRTDLVYSSRADHQVPPSQHCLQDLCTLLSPVQFLILPSATLIRPFAYRIVFPNKQRPFFSHGCQFCYISTQIKYYCYGYLGTGGLAGLWTGRSPTLPSSVICEAWPFLT